MFRRPSKFNLRYATAWHIACFLILVVAIILVMLALFGKVVACLPEPSTMKPTRAAPVTHQRESMKAFLARGDGLQCQPVSSSRIGYPALKIVGVFRTIGKPHAPELE